MSPNLRRSIIVSVLIGLAVAVVLGLVSDIRQVGQGFASFGWNVVPAVLGFTVINYALRWLKWDYFLRRMGMGSGVSVTSSALLFTSGMLMAVTPGKIGEVLKSYLLRRINGTPVSASAPIVLAERLTDGLGMLLLMGIGLTFYPPAQPAFVALLVLSVLGIVVLQSRALFERLVGLVERMPLGARLAPRLATVYSSTQQLLQWRILIVATLMSLVSWFGECLALYFVLLGLQQPPSPHLLLVATFVFAASTLFGLVSFLPGGLGVSEASSAGLLALLVPMPAGPATVATLIIRFCTLWFGVTLGALALAIIGRQHRGADLSDETLEHAPAREL